MLLDHYRALRRAAGVLERAARACIAVGGADRADYLQGLLTNDVAALAPGAGCYAAYLTPQGRLIADMDVFNLGDRLLLDVDAGVRALLAGRFDELIFAEDAAIADWGETHVGYGVHGPAALDVAAAALDALGIACDTPAGVRGLEPHGCCRASAEGAGTEGAAAAGAAVEGVAAAGAAVEGAGTESAAAEGQLADGEPAVVLRTDALGEPGVAVVVPRERGAALHAALRAAGGADVDPAAAETVRIESGLPRFPVDMDGETIPLEAGIEDRAISFTKGCYVGQEVIVRILHRGGGRVARRLVGLALGPAGGPARGPSRADAAAAVPERGAALRHGGEPVGRVTSAAASPALGQVIALGYLPRELTEPGTQVEVDVPGGRSGGVVTATPFVEPASAAHDAG